MRIYFVGGKEQDYDYKPVLFYKPIGHDAYNFANGEYFKKTIDTVMPVITVDISLETLKIEGGIFKDDHLFGRVYVTQNNLLWAVSWKVIDEVLTPAIDTLSIAKAWVSAGYPKEWDGKKEIELDYNYDSLQKQRIKLSQAIKKRERKLERLKECLYLIEYDMQAKI